MLLPNAILFCLKTLHTHGFAAYIVGGCVRDSLLGRTPNDWDLCTSAFPDDITICFEGYKIIPTGIRHGTVTVLVEENAVEITTFRTDGDYLDHRHPEKVVFTRSLAEDLARRDFTINAMAYHPDEGIVDLYGGQVDLADGCIRCVSDAVNRFTEDALRILRMFRFSAQLGFSIDAASLTGAEECKQYLQYISGERVRVELDKILMSERPGHIFALMCKHGILTQFIPEFAACIGFEQNNPYHNRTVDRHIFAAVQAAPADLVVRLALLLHDIGKPHCYRLDEDGIGHFAGHEKRSAQMAEEILERLRYDRRTIERVSLLIGVHDWDIPPEIPRLKRGLSRLGEEAFRQLLNVRIADTSAKDPVGAAPRLEELMEAKAALEHLLVAMPPVSLDALAVNGRDLLNLGFSEGKAVGGALQSLLALVLEDETLNEREILLEKAKMLLTD